MLRPRVGNTICYGQELARKSQRDSAVRFVTAKRGPEGATKTRQYDLLRPRVGQKEPPRLGSTICYGQTWARKSHQVSAVRFVTTQKEPPRLGSTICYGQTWARKSHQDSATRFVTAKNWPEKATHTLQYDLLRPTARATKTRQPEKATKTRQYDLSRPNVGQTKPPRLGSTICYGQELARKSHQDSAVRFVTAKRGPERATKIRQYDLLRPTVGQKKPPRLGSTICYGQTWARKSHQDSAVRFVTAKRGPERATKTRQYDLLRPRVGQKEPPRLGSTICYGQPWAAIRFVTAKRGPEGATKSWQYDLLRPNAGQKKPPRLGSTISYGQELARRSHQDSAVRFVTAKHGPERASKTRQYDLIRPRFVTAKRGPERASKTRQYDLLRQTWARKSHQNSAVRFVTAKSRPNVGQKEPPKLGSTMRNDQMWARKSHQDSAVRFATAKSWPEKATKTRQYDLLRPRVGEKKASETRQYDLLLPRVGQKEPPRLGSTICYGQELARKSHQDSAVRFVTAKSWPETATETRQYDLLRPRVGQKEPPRLGSTT